MNQANCVPLSRYSCIFSCCAFNVFQRDRSSITKSGHNGAKRSCSSSVRASHLSLLTQETSGDKMAPLGRVKLAEESKPIPVPSFSTHTLNCPLKLKLRFPVIDPAGGITIS